jgi:hypothetical protein
MLIAVPTGGRLITAGHGAAGRPPTTPEVDVTVLLWVAVLVAAWFAASVVVALVVGRYLRRCAEGVVVEDESGRFDDALRPLDTGPLRLWLADLPDGADLVRSGPRVPAPREAGADTETTAAY